MPFLPQFLYNLFMMAISHTIVSATIGNEISNPAVSFGIAFVGHFICDYFLHWNFYPHKHKPIALYALIDVALGLFASFLLLGPNFWHISVLSAIVGGLLPDVISFSAYFLKIRIPYFSKFHDGIQRETELFWKGIISQVIVIGIAIATIYLY